MAGSKLDMPNALGAVFLSGVFYTFFTVTGLRSAIFTAVPGWMRAAISCGVGFFITMIGLKIGQIATVTVTAPTSAVSPVALPFWSYDNGIARFNSDGVARMSILGLAFLAFFTTLKVPGAVIISITLTTFAGINAGLGAKLLGDTTLGGPYGANSVTDLTKANWFTADGGQGSASGHWLPDMTSIPSGLLRFDLANTPLFWEAVWTFLAVEMFDSFGTITSCVKSAGGYTKSSKGNALVNRAMLVDGFGLMLGAVIGSNSITCYIESLTGIDSGARTGFASFVTGSAFLLSLLFVRPFVEIIPDAATCCALVWVGVCSLKALREIDWDSPVQLFCTFLTVAVMGFTYSIFNGITFGFIAFTFIQITAWCAAQVAEGNTGYGKLLFGAAGTALVAAGALGPWVIANVYSGLTLTVTFYSIITSAGTSAITPTGQAGAAFSLLLISFILGFAHLLTLAPAVGAKAPAWAPKALAGLALLCSLVGLIVAGASPCCSSSSLSLADPVNTAGSAVGAFKLASAYYSATIESPAFGCAVAGVLAQAIGFVLAFSKETLAKYFKPAAGTDASLPHPLMIVLSIFFVFRYRYLGA